MKTLMDEDHGKDLVETAQAFLDAAQGLHGKLEKLRVLARDVEEKRRAFEERKELCACVSESLGTVADYCSALQHIMFVYAADIATNMNHVAEHPAQHADLPPAGVLVKVALEDVLRENPDITIKEFLEQSGMVSGPRSDREMN